MSVFTLAHGTAGSRWELNSMDAQQVRSRSLVFISVKVTLLNRVIFERLRKRSYYKVRLCSHHTGYLYTCIPFVPTRKLSCIEWTAEQNWIRSFTHFKHRAGVVDRGGQSSLLNMYFHLSGSSPPFTLFQSVTQNLSNIWHSICEIGVASRSFAPSQKFRRNHRSCVWTEALSGMKWIQYVHSLRQKRH